MMTSIPSPTLNRLLDPIRDCLTTDVASRIAALRADAEVEARLEDLAERNVEGLLTEAEQAEYRSLVEAGNLIAVLQAKARAVLAQS